MTRACSVDGCDREVNARGWCKSHWTRWRKYGDPLAPNHKSGTKPFTEAQRVAAFWAKVDQSGDCWLWTAGQNGMGYGSIGNKSGQKLAHRMSYELAYGPIPRGMFVCHTCDTPSCVRPEHLFLGTQADNIADAQRKGRLQSGEAHRHAKLTAEIAALIRTERARGVTHKALAARFCVAVATIQAIVDGHTWKSARRFVED